MTERADSIDSLIEDLERMERGVRLAGEPLADAYEKSDESAGESDSILMSAVENPAVVEAVQPLNEIAHEFLLNSQCVQDFNLDQPDELKGGIASPANECEPIHWSGCSTADVGTPSETVGAGSSVETEVMFQEGATGEIEGGVTGEAKKTFKKLVLVLAAVAGAGTLYCFGGDWLENPTRELSVKPVRPGALSLRLLGGKPVAGPSVVVAGPETAKGAPAVLAGLPASAPPRLEMNTKKIEPIPSAPAQKTTVDKPKPAPLPFRKVAEVVSHPSALKRGAGKRHQHAVRKTETAKVSTDVENPARQDDAIKEIQVLPPDQTQKGGSSQ